MEIKLKAKIAISPEYYTHIGNMTIKNSKIVKFEKTENSHIIEYFSDNIFPIKRSEFEIHFLDKYDDEFKMFNAFIIIKESLKVGVKLNYFEKVKLKWMLKKYLIQSKEIKIELLKYFLFASLGFIGGKFVYHKKCIETKQPTTTPINAPKAGINTSLENSSIKNSNNNLKNSNSNSKKPIKKDDIILK